MKKLLVLFACLWTIPTFSQKGKKDVVEITLTTLGNEIAFDQSTLRIAAGQRIRLRFVNAAKRGSDIHHNVAVLKPGTLDEVLNTLQKEGYQLDKLSRHPSILALSQSIGPGEEYGLELGPLKTGSYPFVCLMAGHGDMLGMKGTLIVSP